MSEGLWFHVVPCCAVNMRRPGRHATTCRQWQPRPGIVARAWARLRGGTGGRS